MMSKSRLEAFSDGVFAILITILVLEFHVPEYHQGRLAAAIAQQWPEFLAYAVSYFYVGTLWLFHHDYFASLKVIDRNLNLINLLSMFSVTLLYYCGHSCVVYDLFSSGVIHLLRLLRDVSLSVHPSTDDGQEPLCV